MERTRINWIDMAKGYGIIAVLIGHMVQNSPIGIFVYSFHLPLFFFLSGYLFNSSVGFYDFIKKKCRGILLPYFTLGLLVVFCDGLYPLLFSGHHFSTGHLLYELSKEFKAFLIQQRYATLWYLAVLFGVNIAAYFICKIKNQILQTIVVIAAFSAAMIYYFVGGRELIWNVDVILPALLFFWGGIVTNKYKIVDERLIPAKYKPAIMLCFLAANIIFNILTMVLSGEGLEMYRCSYGIPPLTVISAFSGIFFVITLSIITTARPILYIGKNSLIYFMWHQAVIYPLLDFAYYMLGFDGYGPGVAGFLAIVFSRLIITCVIMFLITELLSHTPLKAFLGK